MTEISIGFNPENVERIYQGMPALVGSDEKAAEDVLSDKEYEVAALAAGGLHYEEIASEISRSAKTVTTHLHSAYGALGISSKVELAGFFPLDPENPLLEGKTLAQLKPSELEVIEGLSVGIPYKAMAVRSHRSVSTIRTHMHKASVTWPDCEGRAVTITRVASGIRAGYVNTLNGNGRRNRGRIDGYALHKLVSHEQKIRGLIKKQRQSSS